MDDEFWRTLIHYLVNFEEFVFQEIDTVCFYSTAYITRFILEIECISYAYFKGEMMVNFTIIHRLSNTCR